MEDSCPGAGWGMRCLLLRVWGAQDCAHVHVCVSVGAHVCMCMCVHACMCTMGAAAPGRADERAAVQRAQMHEDHVCIWGGEGEPPISPARATVTLKSPLGLPITSTAPRPALQLGFVLDLQRHNRVFFHAVMLTASSFALNW